MSAVRHIAASSVTAEHIGQHVTVAGHVKRWTSTGIAYGWVKDTASGGLSDIEKRDHHHVILYLGGETVDVSPDATVTIGTLDVLGGAG